MPSTPETVLAEEQRRAEEVYDRVIRPILRAEDDGKFVVVAFDATITRSMPMNTPRSVGSKTVAPNPVCG